MPPARDDTGVPRAFAAKRLNVTPHTVSMWVQRGYEATVEDEPGAEPHIEHRTVRTVGWWRGARLYRWGDLVDAERATRNHRNSHRRSPTVDRSVGAAA